MASKNINDLHPYLAPLCRVFLDRCKAAGLDVSLIFTYRTPVEQDNLYAQGRTLPGSKVTNLKGYQSKHCFTICGAPAAKAFDFGIFEKKSLLSKRVYIQDGRDPSYTIAGEIGESLGLEWGGRWKSPFDPGHLQMD
jgi:peptidoglycan LD-endopeptidase CwlK